MPKISPALAVKLTSRSTCTPAESFTDRWLTSSLGRTFSGAGRSMFRLTWWPTIILVSSWGLVSAVGTSPMNSPFRSTATRSLTAMTSWSLWVMMMTLLPSAFMLRSTAKSFSVSWGVSTAVGSSRIRMSVPR